MDVGEVTTLSAVRRPASLQATKGIQCTLSAEAQKIDYWVSLLEQMPDPVAPSSFSSPSPEAISHAMLRDL